MKIVTILITNAAFFSALQLLLKVSIFLNLNTFVTFRQKSRHYHLLSRRNAPFRRSQSLPEGPPKGFADRCTPPKHVEEPTLVLKTRLRYGRISYHEAEKRSGEWTPPKGIEDNLYEKWHSAPNVELLIHEHRETGKTQHHVVVKDNQNKSIVQFLNGIAAKGISHLPFRQDRAHSPPLN